MRALELFIMTIIGLSVIPVSSVLAAMIISTLITNNKIEKIRNEEE